MQYDACLRRSRREARVYAISSTLLGCACKYSAYCFAMDVIAEGLFADISSIDLSVLGAKLVVGLDILSGDAMPSEAAESMTIYVKSAFFEFRIATVVLR
jgi:hypothetical protein